MQDNTESGAGRNFECVLSSKWIPRAVPNQIQDRSDELAAENRVFVPDCWISAVSRDPRPVEPRHIARHQV